MSIERSNEYLSDFNKILTELSRQDSLVRSFIKVISEENNDPLVKEIIRKYSLPTRFSVPELFKV